MNLKGLAFQYKTSVKTLKKWMHEFCPEIIRPDKCKTFTPDQVKRIVEACGEFPS